MHRFYPPGRTRGNGAVAQSDHSRIARLVRRVPWSDPLADCRWMTQPAFRRRRSGSGPASRATATPRRVAVPAPSAHSATTGPMMRSFYCGSGVWDNPTITPLERPRALAGRATLIGAEATGRDAARTHRGRPTVRDLRPGAGCRANPMARRRAHHGVRRPPPGCLSRVSIGPVRPLASERRRCTESRTSP